MGVVTFLDLSLFQSGGGGGDPTKFAPRLVLSATTIASPTATTQVAVSAPDGDVWTISSELEGFTGATGTGSSYAFIRFPENTGETARDIVVTVTGQYGSNSYTIVQREPLDVIATYNINSTGNQTISNGYNWFTYFLVDDDPTQCTGSTYNFQTTGEHTLKFRLKSANLSNIWRVNIPTTVVIPDIEIGYGVVDNNGITDITYYGTSDVQYNTGLTAITLPNVTTIDVYAFNNCTALTSISVPSVTSIGSYAFNNCTALTSISVPSVTSIGSYAFNNCTALATISIPANCNVAKAAFSGSTSLATIQVGNDCVFGERAFQNLSGLTSLTLGTGCTFRGYHNFSDCVSLSELTLPEGTVFSISGQQAYNCTGLSALTVNCDVPAQAFKNTYFGANAEVTIGSGCTSIGEAAFLNGYNISIVNMPSTPLTIEDGGSDTGAFQGCSGMTDIDLSHVKHIGIEAFQNCKNLSGVTLASDFEYIGAWAFYTTKLSGAFVVPTSCNVIGEGAIRHTNITSLSFATGRTNTFVMDKGTYRECTSLTSVTFNDKVAFIGAADNFSGCTQLQEVQGLVVPDEYIASGGTIALAGNNFNKCPNLVRFNSQVDGEFNIPYGYTTVNKNCFLGLTGITTFMVPTTLNNFGEGFVSGCTNLNTFGVHDGQGGVTAETGTFYVPEGITSIVTNAVRTAGTGGNGFRKLVFANTGNCSVQSGAFRGCRVTGITLNNKVDLSVATDCFSENPNLITVTGFYSEILAAGLFKNSSGLTYFNSETQGEAIVPQGCYKIGNNVFMGSTGLTVIDLPASMKEGGTSFSGTVITTIIARPTTAPTITPSGMVASGTLYTPADADYTTWLAALGEGWTQETIPA